MIKGSRTIFNSRTDLFPKIAQEEKYHSACFDILALRLASSIPSCRTCVEVLNHLRWQDDENFIKLRTLSDAVKKEGNKIIKHIKTISKKVLIESDYDTKTGRPIDINAVDETIISLIVNEIAAEEVDKGIKIL